MDDDLDLQTKDYNYIDEKYEELERLKVEKRKRDKKEHDVNLKKENKPLYETVADKSIFCSSCGNKITSDSDECMYCGALIKEKNTNFLFILMWSFVLVGQSLMLVGHLLWEFNSLDRFGLYLSSFIFTFIGSLIHLGYIPCGLLYITHSKDKRKAIYLFVCLGILTIMALVMGFVKLYFMVIFKPVYDSVI